MYCYGSELTQYVKLYTWIYYMDFFYKKNEPQNRIGAYIDLIDHAKLKDSEILVRWNPPCAFFPVKRGQFVTSLGNLARKWKWSKGKVKRFLDDLVGVGLIKMESLPNHQGFCITIIGFDDLFHLGLGGDEE